MQALNSACNLFKLLLVLPATNATSEHSFSTLRQIKSYLRSTMTQARLNHLMILHYHQEMTDELDLKSIANDYILKNETRRCNFATFNKWSIQCNLCNTLLIFSNVLSLFILRVLMFELHWKCLKIQSQSINFSKIFWGVCPQTPSNSMLRMLIVFWNIIYSRSLWFQPDHLTFGGYSPVLDALQTDYSNNWLIISALCISWKFWVIYREVAFLYGGRAACAVVNYYVRTKEYYKF